MSKLSVAPPRRALKAPSKLAQAEANFAVQTDLAGIQLRGLSTLLLAWGGACGDTNFGREGHENVMSFLSEALWGLAERLDTARETARALRYDRNGATRRPHAR